MIPFIRHAFHVLLWDEMLIRRILRAGLLGIATAMAQIASVGWEVASVWTAKDWGFRALIALMAAFAGLIGAGTKLKANITDPSDIGQIKQP